MKLAAPFIQLPLRFDAPALAAEIARLDESAWVPHPQGFAGNSALPLIAVNGDVDEDGVEGPMRATPLLARLPYLRQVLGSLGAVLGRTRLMRLSGNAEVKPHIDQGYYWAERMRVHVPVVTTPGVRFHCGGAQIHMAAGECWIFDTWRLHRVHNEGEQARIHLVVDTVGGDGLWDLLARGRPHPAPTAGWPVQNVSAGEMAEPTLEFESLNLPKVMSPWELRSHIGFLFTECQAHADLPVLQQSALRFLRRWQAQWTAHGEADIARPRYQAILDEFVADVRRLGRNIGLRNEVTLSDAMQAMVTKAALSGGRFAPRSKTAATRSAASTHMGRDEEFDRPVFIVSSPRSGSTLLFETLARARNVCTIGGESHGLIETLGGLHPAARGYDSNRLDADAATPEVALALRARFLAALRDRTGSTPARFPLRMLEKTPKNSLRVPFLARVFPEAHFIYLYRDPRETLASMIEAWQSGTFRTYPDLPGWSGPPWSLLLTPGWRELSGRPLADIVTAQWEAASRILLGDLENLPPDRRSAVRYDALLRDPPGEIARLCAAVDFESDGAVGQDLPLSRYTVSKPDAQKWRRHADVIEPALAAVAATIARAELAAA
jgi:hypothetical protein